MENGVVSLINHMDGFEHAVCVLRGLGMSAERLATDRVRTIQIGKREGFRLQLPQVSRAIRQTKADIVHSNNWGAIEAVIAARIAGVGAVHTEHGFDETFGAGEPMRRAWMRRIAYEAAHQVVCVSRHLRDCRAQRSGFPARRIAVIHNGVNCERFSPDPDARERVRRELQIGANEFVLGCVGNLLPVKDHMTLLRALDRLSEAAENWRLVLVGEGPERPKLEAAVRKLRERGARVILHGASARVPELLTALDLYVLPSISEGLSYSLLEAMATGLPVVASNVGGNPEVVQDGISGLLFPAGDAGRLADLLLQVQRAGGWREQLGHAARERVQREFSIESMVREYERVYRSLLPAPATQVGVEA
jgi:sugar transferase (PEP-CTERM/EpsH1 system associated)